jgi:hypothetical protein
MALISLGSGITSIRGKIGGTVYQGSASGTISKNRGYKTKNSSVQAARAMTTLNQLSQYWLTLSTIDRAAWNAYAIYKPTLQKNGTGRFLNGQQLFMYYSFRYFLQFQSIPSAPTFVTNSFPYSTFDIFNTYGALDIFAGFNIDETVSFLNLKISNSIPEGRNYATGGLKYIYTLFNNNTSTDITTKYNDVFGRVPQVGEYLIIEAQLYSATNANWTNVYKAKVIVQ